MNNKILIADDSSLVRESLADYFSMHFEKSRPDIKLLTAATRQQALSIIAETDGIAVVVTDLHMPSLTDGEAVATTAQQKGIKVIMLSSDLRGLNEAVRANCLAVLNKQDSEAQDVAILLDSCLKQE